MSQEDAVFIPILVAASAVCVQFAVCRTDQIIAPETFALAVVAVLEAIGGRAARSLEPALIDHAANAILADVLVTRVAVEFATLLDEREIDNGSSASKFPVCLLYSR